MVDGILIILATTVSLHPNMGSVTITNYIITAWQWNHEPLKSLPLYYGTCHHHHPATLSYYAVAHIRSECVVMTYGALLHAFLRMDSFPALCWMSSATSLTWTTRVTLVPSWTWMPANRCASQTMWVLGCCVCSGPVKRAVLRHEDTYHVHRRQSL